MSRRTKSKPSPAQIAESSVRQFFASFVSSTDVLDADFLDDVIGKVAEALTVEHVKAASTRKNDNELREILGQQAGYLVGIQVGLRLAGGIR